MKEGKHGEKLLFSVPERRHPMAALQRIGDKIVMRQYHALWGSRGPARILKERDIFAGHINRPLFHRTFHEPVPRNNCWRDRQAIVVSLLSLHPGIEKTFEPGKILFRSRDNHALQACPT